MTTVVNTPANGESTNLGFMVGALLVLVIGAGLFFVYGLPMIKRNSVPNTMQINVQLPKTTPQ